jgi:hypothetical protein
MPRGFQRDLDEQAGEVRVIEFIEYAAELIVTEVLRGDARSEELFGGFASIEMLEQVQGCADEAEAVEDHRFDRNAATDYLLGMGSKFAVEGVHEADIIDDAGNDSVVIQVE